MTVIKLGGAVALTDAAVAELAATWKHNRGPFAVVHGAGPQLDEALTRFGEPQRIRGLRVTTPEAAQTVADTLDDVGARLAAKLRDAGVPAVHVPSTARLFRGRVKDIPGIGRVGDAVGFDANALAHFAPDDAVAVVTPVGWDKDGPLNINADEGAAGLAKALGAPRLVFATDVPSIHDEHGQPIAAMDIEAGRRFLASKAAQGGIIPKVEAALACLEHGVPEIRIGAISCASGQGGTCLTA